jgi:catechol 2,3-dioxygenase-like lactoylglutathione lyase family enzyme
MIGRKLAYIALIVSDVEATAATLARDFGLRRTNGAVGDSPRTVPVFGVGATALALFPPADPFVSHEATTGVHHLAFAVGDLTVAAATAAAAGVPAAESEPHKGLGGAGRLRLSPQATVGVKTSLSEPLAVEPSRGGWVERIDHLGVAGADHEAALDVFGRRLGCPLESTQTDMEGHIAVESFTSDRYGVVYHTRAPEPVGGLRVAFITVGDGELEFLQEVDAHQGGRVAQGRPGSTRQDQGAIGRFIAARGPGLHHVALKVTDINGALARLKRAGHALIDTAGRPGSRRALIGFMHPKSLNGVLMHLVQRQDLLRSRRLRLP